MNENMGTLCVCMEARSDAFHPKDGSVDKMWNVISQKNKTTFNVCKSCVVAYDSSRYLVIEKLYVYTATSPAEEIYDIDFFFMSCFTLVILMYWIWESWTQMQWSSFYSLLRQIEWERKGETVTQSFSLLLSSIFFFIGMMMMVIWLQFCFCARARVTKTGRMMPPPHYTIILISSFSLFPQSISGLDEWLTGELRRELIYKSKPKCLHCCRILIQSCQFLSILALSSSSGKKWNKQEIGNRTLTLLNNKIVNVIILIPWNIIRALQQSLIPCNKLHSRPHTSLHYQRDTGTLCHVLCRDLLELHKLHGEMRCMYVGNKNKKKLLLCFPRRLENVVNKISTWASTIIFFSQWNRKNTISSHKKMNFRDDDNVDNN